MNTSVFDHPWLGGLFSDAETAAIWAPERQLSHMLAFEAAWSRALGACGLFDATLAENAARAIEQATISPEALGTGTRADGVPVPALVEILKTIAPAEAVHKGATSQDVIDTALAMTLGETTGLFLARLDQLIATLTVLERRFGDNELTGRTRMQAAMPITVRDRVLSWRLPLDDHVARLQALRPRVEKVQIGGAAGDRSALGDKADAIVADVARALGLRPTEKAWHAMRDGIGEYASALSLISGTLGKIGQDIALMAQQGIDEIALSGGGGSSAMPHKSNPVLAELLVTLSRFNAAQLSGMHQALIHEQERSGAAWSLEWMILPQMAMATGRGLGAAIDLCGKVERMGTG
ncbi:3-carboxy-cis,cis-muconate cycloisomerase [Martelella mediterranea]|uniref:3-carboxy-cis,cis-muconate cycloisomerase n=1 Tax=Martelella mediterranea DSM 17316 TaxID=1122214 RepID=A0A1U9Z1N6_9HYPH|nr:3-carboxy-cis,cis-muconate cycloisomerase [Martelella mediterranea]AQZ51588.1 3-carboxy-cis,cis-muconate cycloisomerase [Martelella mediterranea DSM 17316]